MPRFQPERYSISVSIPARATNTAHRCAIWRVHLPPLPHSPCGSPSGGELVCSSHSDTPIRAKAAAVFAFIVTSPGRMLFNNVTLNIQPISTATPTARTSMLAAAEMDLNKETRRELDCKIILESILKNSSAALGQQDGQRARIFPAARPFAARHLGCRIFVDVGAVDCG